MCSRTKSVRLPTDFIDTVWLNSPAPVVGDAEAAAEGGAVGGEAGFELDVGQLAQAFAQGVEVAAEAGEVFGDRQRTVRDHIEAFRLAAVVADVEHLGEGDVLVEALVVEMAEDHRIAVAQRHRLGAEAGFAALGLVVTQHVGAQRAFLASAPAALL